MELAIRAGTDPRKFDATALEGEVRGFAVINAYPCSGALRALSEIFMFDPSNHDGKVYFVHRGGPSVAVITEDEMVDDEDDIEESKRMDSIQVPRVLHLNYHDVAGGLATDKQTSERAGDRRSVGEVSLQSAVVMSADEAMTAVVVNHKVQIENQKGELHFSLPDKYIALVPSNPIIVQWQGRSERARIVKADTNDGYQEYVCLRDRQSAYTTIVEGIPAAPQTPPPSSVVGPTLIEFLDIPILRDSDDALGLGYYVAVSGLLEAWQGATVELSYDGGVNYVDSQIASAAAVIGETVSVFADHPQAYPDQVHTVRVLIDTPLAELLEIDLIGMLNRGNLALIGNEIVQFANAEETSEGIWELSYFLRGRKGTSTELHPIGSRFVLLERDVLPFITAELTDIGRTLTFRATSLGATPDTGTVLSIVYAGVSQMERQPAYLQARRDGIDALISWQGVGRLGAGAQVSQGAYFLGYRVTLSDGVLTQTYDTLLQALTQDVSGFSAPLNIRVQQRNQFTGLGPYIEATLQ